MTAPRKDRQKLKFNLAKQEPSTNDSTIYVFHYPSSVRWVLKPDNSSKACGSSCAFVAPQYDLDRFNKQFPPSCRLLAQPMVRKKLV